MPRISKYKNYSGLKIGKLTVSRRFYKYVQSYYRK